MILYRTVPTEDGVAIERFIVGVWRRLAHVPDQNRAAELLDAVLLAAPEEANP